MPFCRMCGSEVAVEDTHCRMCGELLEPLETPVANKSAESRQMPSSSYEDQLGAAKEAVSDAASKLKAGAMSFSQHVGKRVEAERQKLGEKARTESEGLAATTRDTRPRESGGDKYMSSTELWSWLKQSDRRQLYYTEEPSQVRESEFMEALDRKLAANGIPATVEQRQIHWDRSKIGQNVYCIKPLTKETNPITCMVQFKHVGNYTFVESKNFITPPDLPAVPGPKVSITSQLSNALKFGLISLALIITGVAFLGSSPTLALPLILCGLVPAGISIYFIADYSSRKSQNDMVAAQQLKWNKAWSNWEDSIFIHSFQEDINGQVSRVYEASLDTVKQVSTELLKQKPTMDTQETASRATMEQLIKERKQSYRSGR